VSANGPEFDALFRGHLANVYTLLGQPPPDELSRPIAKFTIREFHEPPAGPVRATIDGEVSSYFEWMGAGVYRVVQRTGAMHGHRFLVNELRYGSDGQNLFLRIDFLEPTSVNPETTEIRISLENTLDPGSAVTRHLPLNLREDHLESSFGRVYEVKLPLSLARIAPGHNVRFQVSIWQSGLPMEALPPHGWIDFSTAEPVEWVL
jgi:hypothetical protein